TYWPPDSRHGRPGFGQVLLAVADAWKDRRNDLTEQGEKILTHLQEAVSGPAAANQLDVEWIAQAEDWLIQNVDQRFGGWGDAPKFPHATDISLLLEGQLSSPTAERELAIRTTLNNMMHGGIYDHLGGGFARYSVDRQWLVPHFEKMLYDNALLANSYAAAARLFNDPEYVRVTRETLDYVLRDMTDKTGAFYSTEDADSEGEEGKFYVWGLDEIREILGSDADEFAAVYDCTEGGNFEGHNILNLKSSIAQYAKENSRDLDELTDQLARCRKKLFVHRNTRVRPGLDDKVIVSWNALMITAMVGGFRVTGDAKYLKSAEEAVDFIQSEMIKSPGRLWHSWRQGKASHDAYLDDYTYLIEALCELFQVSPRAETLRLAIELSDTVIKHFAASDSGFYFTADYGEELIARSKDLADSSVPSANGMAASGLLALGRLTGQDRFIQAAESALVACSGIMARSPQAGGQALRALRRFSAPSQEWILVLGEDANAGSIAERLYSPLTPKTITIAIPATDITDDLAALCPLLAGRSDGQSTQLFVCENNVCQLPLTGNQIDAKLDQL
ncbi:MAG TPA: thioredoxin domain-containing protein, partial [Planctomycetaceae bacterium]|nr:thioredoxin domain-containing protein [Planctomycetaceae bacterium]